MSDQPQRRTVPFPSTGDIPRVGKIRLGVKKTTRNRAGEDVTYPSATDYFVVTADDGGVTNPESAESFYDVYPDEPRVLSCVLPAATAEQCMEGAWRLYGTGKLKRKCDGTECDERTATGGWVTQPCICEAKGIPSEVTKGGNLTKNPLHCRLIFTFNVLLPGVQGVGVWQVETQSEISARRIANWLRMMETLLGNLRMVPFELHLVPVSVAPDGKSKTVYVLEPRATAQTQAAIGAGTTRTAIESVTEAYGPDDPELPGAAADEDGADYSYEDPVDGDPGSEEERAGREPADGGEPPREPETNPAGDSPSAGLSRLEELKAMPSRLQAEDPDRFHEANLPTIRQSVVAAGIEWKTRALADDETWARVKAIVEQTCLIHPDTGQQTLGGAA